MSFYKYQSVYMIKIESLAICYAVIFEEQLKKSNTVAQKNQNLYRIGEQMGVRLADQYMNQKCSFLSPAQTIKRLLVEITKQYLGISLNLISDNIRFEKRHHFYNITLQQADFGKSLLDFCEDYRDFSMENHKGGVELIRAQSIAAGFLFGVLVTMGFYGKVLIEDMENSQGVLYRVQVIKDIKQED